MAGNEDPQDASSDTDVSVNTSAASSDNEYQQPVAQLARSFSITRTFSSFPSDVNPFLSKDPKLDPNSKSFDGRLWVRTLLHVFSQDPSKYPRHTAGVSYRSLNVHGYGFDTDYQKDVANILWRLPVIALDFVRSRKSRIQILQHFDGLIKSGEMLLVLGRPGR